MYKHKTYSGPLHGSNLHPGASGRNIVVSGTKEIKENV